MIPINKWRKYKRQLKDAHELFNNYFFKSMLNTPNFIISKTFYVENVERIGNNVEAWGYYEHPGRIGITVNRRWHIILLHEMIHQYQYEFDMEDKNHGVTFDKFARYMELELNLYTFDIDDISI